MDTNALKLNGRLLSMFHDGVPKSILKLAKRFRLFYEMLTHCGLVMPYVDIDLGQHCVG